MSRSVSIPNGDKHDFKLLVGTSSPNTSTVSIPNGDKHDFKHTGGRLRHPPVLAVSIPNGDKHDFKPLALSWPPPATAWFQSPMGISMISNPAHTLGPGLSFSFNPQWG